MAKKVSLLSVFVASPGDVSEERECLEEVVRELNLLWSRSKGIRLELVRWETHVYPGVASDPQTVINEQIGDDYDIFVGILWKTFGTPTRRAGSGTEEEFDRAYRRCQKDPSRLRIMFYFKTAAPDLSEIDPTELGRVRDFQSKLGPKGTLFWEFKTREDFMSLARMHLSLCVDDWGRKWGEPSATGPRVEALAEGDVEPPEEEEYGFLDLIEIGTSSFQDLTDQANRIGESTGAYGEKISQRTAELGQVLDSGGEADLKRLKRICNTAADNLDSYATIMDAEVPLFASNLTLAIDTYARAASMLPEFGSEREEFAEQLDDAIEAVAELRSSLGEAGAQLSRFRDAIAGQPRITTKYNRAKRHAVKILDSYLAELLSGEDRLAESQKALAAMRADLASED